MKHLAFAVALLVHCLAYAAPCLKGVTDKDPLSYAVGEDIVFTVSLEGAESFPDGVSATWRRSGDDGVEEKGTWDGRAPLTVKTKLKRAGFVRLTVEPRQTANGNPWRVKGASGDVFFDGGAGVGVNMLVQSKPEPKDFDAFWKTCRDELDAVPVKADLEVEEMLRNPEVPDIDAVQNQIGMTADDFALDMLVLKFIQGLPVVGVVGGLSNPVYYNKIMEYVRLKYHKRYLLSKKEDVE